MSDNGRYEIAQVGFEDAGISITYMRVPDDIRVGGAVFAQHTLSIAAGHPQYTGAITDLRELITDLLNDALEDFHDSLPYTPPDEDDDERGMGE